MGVEFNASRLKCLYQAIKTCSIGQINFHIEIIAKDFVVTNCIIFFLI